MEYFEESPCPDHSSGHTGGGIPVFVLRGIVLSSYEKREVARRTAEIQNQCTILCNQLSDANYLTGETSEVLRSELVQMSNIYSGRIMVIDHDFRIQEDTYDMDKGKTIVSEDVIRCFQEKAPAIMTLRTVILKLPLRFLTEERRSPWA